MSTNCTCTSYHYQLSTESDHNMVLCFVCACVCWCRDIFSLTKNPQLLSDCVTLLVDHIKKHSSDVDVIVGLDARGFIFGSLVAQQMSLPFVPVRKEGKLPGETIKVAYTLEYNKVIKHCM